MNFELRFWTAATCRRFLHFVPQHFPSRTDLPDQSGSAADESCDKSQHSKCLAANAYPIAIVSSDLARSFSAALIIWSSTRTKALSGSYSRA